jgi:hypothetical protein
MTMTPLPTNPATAGARRRTALRAAAALAAALALAAAGCGGDDQSGGDVDPASMIPASATGYLGVVTRPAGEDEEGAERVSRAMFGTESPGQAVIDLAAKASGQTAVSFDEDVEPWLGDRVGVALNAGGGGGDEIILVAASRDDDKARETLEQSAQLTETTSFRDVEIRYSSDSELAGAVFDGAVVLGRPNAVESVISAVHDDAVLSDSARYAAAIDELPGDGADGVATVYLDVGAIAQLVGGLLGGGAVGQLIEPIVSKQGDAIAAAVGPDEAGIEIDAVATGTGSGIAAVQAQGGASDAIAPLPGDSWLALGISDVGGTVNSLLDAASSAGGLQAVGLTVLLNEIEASLGLKLRGDILAWMGRGGLFVRGTEKGEVNGALVIQSKDRAAMRRTVRALRRAGGGLPSGAVAGSLKAAGIDDGATLNLGSFRFEVAAAGDELIIAMGPGALRKALNPGTPLAATAGFRAAQQQLGDDVRPGLYADLPQLGTILARAGKGGALIGEVLGRMSHLAAGGKQDGDVSRVTIVAGVPGA